MLMNGNMLYVQVSSDNMEKIVGRFRLVVKFSVSMQRSSGETMHVCEYMYEIEYECVCTRIGVHCRYLDCFCNAFVSKLKNWSDISNSQRSKQLYRSDGRHRHNNR